MAQDLIVSVQLTIEDSESWSNELVEGLIRDSLERSVGEIDALVTSVAVTYIGQPYGEPNFNKAAIVYEHARNAGWSLAAAIAEAARAGSNNEPDNWEIVKDWLENRLPSD